jgi:hypothetical protein
MCEIVHPDRVNWFVYGFELKTDLLEDPKFVETFKKGLIFNIAGKYDLAVVQITVSSVEKDGMTSFQIMPFYAENMDEFDKKMAQIDIDLNSHEFRSVLPAVARATGDGDTKYPDNIETGKVTSKWRIFKTLCNPRNRIYVIGALVGWIVILAVVGTIYVCRRRMRYAKRSESKSPIYDTSYHQAAVDDEHYHAVNAPDGTTYVVVESDEKQSSNDKRALV